MKTLTTLLTRPFPAISTFVTASALCLSAWTPAASIADEVHYRPIQSITQAVGSKFLNGYFEQQAGGCVVTLMLTEHREPEDMQPGATPVRLRLVLGPGQVAGLDSEEGHSVNLACGEDTSTLHVDAGEREYLMVQQMRAHQRLTATMRQK